MAADLLAGPGRFVTLEGSEGAGKSTQSHLLAARLRAAGLTVIETREPGGAPGAEILRGLLLSGDIMWSLPAETLLHFAARAEHVERTIRPALADGTWVVCDRFYDSTVAYQGYGQGGDRTAISTLTGLLGIVPDLTVVLDVEVATSKARLRARGTVADRYERLSDEFFARVREGFLMIARTEPDRCKVLDADRDPDSLADEIWQTVQSRLFVR